MADSVVISLPDNLTIMSADALHEQLEPFVIESQNIQIDAAAVTRVDTAGLQLVYAFIQVITKNGAACSWLSVPACLSDAAEQLGLKEHLHLK